jgi:uncharacterized membrane protein
MSETNAKAGAPRMRRGVRIVLFASLALNLLVAGLVLGAVLTHRDRPDRHPPRFDQVAGPMSRAMSHEDRRAIGQAMRQAFREERPTREAVKAEYDRVIAALETVPFDSQAVRESVERQMAATDRRMRLGREVLLNRIEAMSDGERAAFAARLREELSRARLPGGRRWAHD